MKLNEGRNRSVALLQYGKKAKLLLGNGVPEDYIITACKFCGDISNATNIAIMVKQWLKYAPEEIKGTIQTLSLEEWSNKLADVIENRKVPHCFIQAGSWKVGEFDNYEDCQLFPVQNNWCICKDPKWIDNYHNKDSRLLIIYNPNLPTKFKYMVAELEHNGIISFWDIENSSTDFQQFPEYTSILPKVIKDYLFKVSLSNNPYKAYNKMMESKNYKNMKKNVKRINESQLRTIVAESVKKVLSEKYNPWKRVEREDGSIEHPRYDVDTIPYKAKLRKQAQHLYDQIEYFLQTLEHAYPNFPDAKTYNDYNRSSYGFMQDEGLESHLEAAKRALNRMINPSFPSTEID